MTNRFRNGNAGKCYKYGKPWQQRGVKCAEVGDGPDQLDNSWNDWDYRDDYGDQSRVYMAGGESSIDLEHRSLAAAIRILIRMVIYLMMMVRGNIGNRTPKSAVMF